MYNQNHRQGTRISANPPARQGTSLFWILGAALILGLLLAVSGSTVPTASGSSHTGSLEIVSVTLNGGASWVPNVPDDGFSTGGGVALVDPGDLIDIVLVANNGACAATEWVFGNSGDPGTFACVSAPEPNYSGNAPNPRTANFTILAPSGDGTYDLTLIVHPNPNCSGTNVDSLTLVGAFGLGFPVITAPSDIVVAATGPSGTPDTDLAIIAFLASTSATDAADGDLTGSITHDGPAVYPLGGTLVTFSVTDSDGHTATATATVTVVDATDPVITAPSDIVVEATGPTGTPDTDPAITAFLIGATATDVVDGDLTGSITHDGPAMYPLGGTLVTFSVTDSAGNTSTASATVTVADTTAPVISAPSDIVVAATGLPERRTLTPPSPPFLAAPPPPMWWMVT